MQLCLVEWLEGRLPLHKREGYMSGQRAPEAVLEQVKRGHTHLNLHDICMNGFLNAQGDRGLIGGAAQNEQKVARGIRRGSNPVRA